MKKEVKRPVYLILIAIILFSASMSVPQLYNSKWRDPVQGGAAGLAIAALLGTLPIFLRKDKNKVK